MNKKLKLGFLLVILLLCASCDLSTKWLAKQHLQYAPEMEIVPDYLNLHYTENDAIAFSMLKSISPPMRNVIIYSTSFFAFIVLGIITYQSRRESFLWLSALMLIIAGAVGNLVDRIMNGYVVDFIHLHYQSSYHWPIFNVADISITIGAIILAFLMLKKSYTEKKELT